MEPARLRGESVEAVEISPSSRTASLRTECLPGSPSTFHSVSTAQRLKVPPLRHSPSVGSWMKNGLLLLLLLPLSRAVSRRLVAVAWVSPGETSFVSVARAERARTERVAALCTHHHLTALRRLLARAESLQEIARAMVDNSKLQAQQKKKCRRV